MDGPYLYRITSDYFVAGFILRDHGHVHPYRIAPIIGCMRYWHLSKVIRYCEEKGWQIRRVMEW